MVCTNFRIVYMVSIEVPVAPKFVIPIICTRMVPCTWIVHFNKLLLLLLFGVRCARPGESENTLSVHRPHPHTTNRRKEDDKTVGVKKERADHANRKALALLLKPASPTPSNKWSLRSFQRDTERGTKLLRY